ncbi:MAG: hypothetical protein ACFFE6_00190 [Candidatus Thorarchaeota archaeon]
MRSYELGTLNIDDHEAEKLTEALAISNDRFETIVNLAKEAWDHEDTISESIEYLAQRAKESREANGMEPISGSELVLAYVFFGRIWEDQQEDDQ